MFMSSFNKSDGLKFLNQKKIKQANRILKLRV